MLAITNSMPATNQTAQELNCDVNLNVSYDNAIAGICVAMGLFGLVYTFVGYRCFKAVMFLSGLVFGGTVVYVLCQKDGMLHHSLSYEAIFGIALGVGVLCGFITMLVRYVGLFLQGFFLGLLLAVGAILALQKYYRPSTPWIPVGILFATGIIFSLFTLKWQKLFVIVSTSVMGAVLICACIEYFLEKFLLIKFIWKALMSSSTRLACWYAWVILGIWPVLSVLGCLVQWKFTAKGYDHTDVIIYHGQRKRVRTHLVRQLNHSHDDRNTVPSISLPESRLSRSHGRSRSSRHLGRAGASGTDLCGSASSSTNFDSLPPSYDDCVERGVGKPVSVGDLKRIIRTKHGSFLTPSGQTQRRRSANVNEGRSATSATPFEQPLHVSCGKSGTRDISHARHDPSRRSGAGREAGLRRHSPSVGASHEVSDQHQYLQRRGQPFCETRDHTNDDSSVALCSRPRLDDRQLLLSSDSSTQLSASSQDWRPTAGVAVAAHARRLRAIQQRRGNNM